MDKLEEKWGKFAEENTYFCNGNMPFISNQAKLNVLFKPIDSLLVSKVFENNLKKPILPELKAFYEKYNGCRLFFGSFSIWGIPQVTNDVFVPYNIIVENINVTNIKNRDELVFFGSLGGEYLFAYNINEMSTIYCYKKKEQDVVCTYENFNQLCEHFINGLIDEYDVNCEKIHKNIEYKGIPVLEHLTYKLF